MIAQMSRRPLAIALALLAPGVLTACGGSGGDEAQAAATSTTSARSTSTTAEPTTTSASTTSRAVTTTTDATTSSTSTSTSSTTSSTTTLPQPIPPPADPNAAEPVIELGRIAIPKIGVDMALYEGIRLTTLDHGPGHWPGSAMPGQLGNSVIGGHRTSKHKVFRNVDDLVAGDQIVFTDPDGTEHVYIVNRVEVVEPDAMWIVEPTSSPTATLFACHPPGSTRQRIVVFADLQA